MLAIAGPQVGRLRTLLFEYYTYFEIFFFKQLIYTSIRYIANVKPKRTNYVNSS